MDLYRHGITGKLVEYAVKKYKSHMVREVYNHQFLHVIFKRIEVHFCRSFLKNSSIVA